MTTEIVEIPGYVAGTWAIDPVHSTVGFTIRHMMISKVRGRFGAFEGTLVTAPDPLRSQVTATIDLTSVDTGNAQRDDHIRTPDFLDVARYPSMSFRSTGLRAVGGGFVMDGELSLRGVTKTVPLDLEIEGFGPDVFHHEDPFKGVRAGFTATGEIDRTDFGVGDSATIPGGALALSERVQIILEIQAALQTEL